NNSSVGDHGERYQRCLRRIGSAHGDGLPLEVPERRNPRVLSGKDFRRQVAVSVPHGERAAVSMAFELALDPGQGRVPGHINFCRKVRLDLGVVVRIKDVVNLNSPLQKIALEAFPDGHHLGVVGHRADTERPGRIFFRWFHTSLLASHEGARSPWSNSRSAAEGAASRYKCRFNYWGLFP